ncbi:hypothetical protein [Nitrospira moscoviensis]|uniref:Peptidase C39 domain-containing protein n=1 Tax=Nitrospira moscoviensis TaxID=42253 RepID=A0A0K2GCY8_NITMO|nr:hypothetical protein [Nitrospira moscoviensis]ALA58452.1 conserved exported protein of unknown function [Nitrospira moscoviensis]
MKPVVQLDRTGCGIASAAAIAGISYGRAKAAAAALGISIDDDRLWSDTAYVRQLLGQLGRRVDSVPRPFRSWDTLPGCALLAIKWHRQGTRAAWHWVVYVREDGRRYVLDSKRALKSHVRRDFGRMRPKWYLAVMPRGSR